ncbi:MAG: phosphonate ABC transporter, permease protein PhnE, partial [Pseudomonadota bacterium]|nr:phosphonate ABC transporter, permease protein PhnE [Pseudomonadota bacterium]
MTPTPQDIQAAMAAHPRAFRDTPAVRMRKIALWIGFIGLFCWCLYDFNFAPERILNGMQRMGRILSFMFPPHLWETWAEWLEVFKALGETVAMAFLGTVLGLIVAFPLSFLGAKNINRIFWLRQSTRRGYDIIRAFEILILALIFIRA